MQCIAGSTWVSSTIVVEAHLVEMPDVTIYDMPFRYFFVSQVESYSLPW